MVPSARKPSPTLLAAGLAGLLGVTAAVACSEDKTPSEDSVGSNGTGGATDGAGGATAEGGSSGGPSATPTDTYNNLVDGEAADMTMETFRTLCEEQGGLVYVNAACAGSSMCKGLSLHDGELWDHSCRGQNSTCSGVGCLALPEDAGLSGQDIYENGPCGDCHGDWSAPVEEGEDAVADYTKYAIFYDPLDRTADEATERFRDSTDTRLEAIVGWGTQGFHNDSLPFSNMPSYYQKYSLAEIRRVVEYVRGLCTFTYPYGVFGEEEPEGGYVQSAPDPACD